MLEVTRVLVPRGTAAAFNVIELTVHWSRLRRNSISGRRN